MGWPTMSSMSTARSVIGEEGVRAQERRIEKMKSLGLITKIGPAGSRPKFPDLPANGTDFAIDVELSTGEMARLELSQSAAVELAGELQICVKGRGAPR